MRSDADRGGEWKCCRERVKSLSETRIGAGVLGHGRRGGHGHSGRGAAGVLVVKRAIMIDSSTGVGLRLRDRGLEAEGPQHAAATEVEVARMRVFRAMSVTRLGAGSRLGDGRGLVFHDDFHDDFQLTAGIEPALPDYETGFLATEIRQRCSSR